MQIKLAQKIVITLKFALYIHDNNAYTRNFSQRQIQKHLTECQHYNPPPLLCLSEQTLLMQEMPHHQALLQ